MKDKQNTQMGMPNFFGFSLATHNTPKFSESGTKQWINYGNDNLYPNFLVGLLDNSSKHNAIVKRKTDLTAGEGWINEEDLVANVNGKEDLNDIVYKNAYDLNLYGAFALIVTWSKDKKSIARIKFVSISKVRIAKEFDEKTEEYKRQQEDVDFYYISEDWSNTRKAKNKPQLIQGYSEQFNDEATQLLYVKEYRPGVEFYSLPDYISSIDWIDLDKEIANFHLNSVNNGFTPSMIINFNQGTPTDEEQRSIVKKIKEKYSGTDNASNVFVTFSEGAESKPDFVPINLNDSDERFLLLETHIQSNIVTGHRIPPIIAGVQIEGKLGSSDEIKEQEQLFQSQIISAKQTLIERAYTKILGTDMTLKHVTTFPIDEIVDEVIEEIKDETITETITETKEN